MIFVVIDDCGLSAVGSTLIFNWQHLISGISLEDTREDYQTVLSCIVKKYLLLTPLVNFCPPLFCIRGPYKSQNILGIYHVCAMCI